MAEDKSMAERFFAFGKFKGFVFGSDYDAMEVKSAEANSSLKAQLEQVTELNAKHENDISLLYTRATEDEVRIAALESELAECKAKKAKSKRNG